VSGGWVSVVGTVNRDVILTADGSRRESLGGILYNALPLAALLEDTGLGVRVHGRLGADDRRETEALAAGFPELEIDGLIADPAGTNLSVLDYRGPGDRREEVRLRVAALDESDLGGVIGARAVLVNLISGRDLSRETLAAIRARTPGPFFLDVQALARTLDSPRASRLVPDWREWVALFDVVRGNEEEIAWFGGRPGDPLAAARRIRAVAGAEVLVTRGARGAWRLPAAPEAPTDPGEPPIEEIPAFRSAPGSDPTGCGDAFLAGVVAARVLGADPAVAAGLGAFVAGEVAGLSGLDSLGRLRGVRARAAAAMPALVDPRDRREAPPGPSGPAR
jgi:sugar/nucleoside kinase (ribokinase family)